MLVFLSLTFRLPAGNMVQTIWKTGTVFLFDKIPNGKPPIKEKQKNLGQKQWSGKTHFSKI